MLWLKEKGIATFTTKCRTFGTGNYLCERKFPVKKGKLTFGGISLWVASVEMSF